MFKISVSHFKKPLAGLLAISLALTAFLPWTRIFQPQSAEAAASISVSMQGLPLQYIDGYRVGRNSDRIPILRIDLNTIESTVTASSVTAYFYGTGFATSSLALLGAGQGSGVQLVADTGSSTGVLDAMDPTVFLNAPPQWHTMSTTTYSVVLSDFTSPPLLATGATTTFYLAVRTSASPVNNSQIMAAIPADGIVTTAMAPNTGPAAMASSTSLKIDTVAPALVSVEKKNDYSVEAVFSEDIGSGLLNMSNYAISSGTISTIAYAGPNRARIDTTSLVVASSTWITARPGITDTAGNQLATTTKYVSLPQKIVISEIMAHNGSGDMYEFVELYNPGGASVDVSGWTLERSGPYNGTVWTTMASIASSTFIAPGKFHLIASVSFNAVSATDGDTEYATDYLYNEGTHIRLMNVAGSEIDRAAWGIAAYPEGTAAPALSSAMSLERKAFGASTGATMSAGGQDEFKGNGWDSNSNYYDFVLRTIPDPQNSYSASEFPDYDNFASGGLSIEHAPVWFAETSTDFVIYARIGDPNVPFDQLTAAMKYAVGDGSPGNNVPADYTAINGTYIARGVYRFTVPQAVIASSSQYGFYYYLKAAKTDEEKFMFQGAEYIEENSDTYAAMHPYSVSCYAPSAHYTLTGNVSLEGATSSSAVLVYLLGSPYSTTTDASGNFSISVKPGSYENIVFLKDGYYDLWVSNIGIYSNLNLPAKTMNIDTGGMFSGDTMSPYVKWTGPPNGETNLPAGDANFKILISFSKDIATSTLTASSVFMTMDGVSGLPGYGFSYNPVRESWMSSPQADPYLLVITMPPGGLSAGTRYYLLLSGAIRDTSGNSLAGNSTSGGHEVSFMTGLSVSGFDYGTGANMPPKVMNINPGGGMGGASRNTKIAVSFSEPMDRTAMDISSSTAGAIKLYAITYSGTSEISTPVIKSISLDSSSRVAIVTPASSLSASARYRVIVNGAARSAAGIYAGDAALNNNSESFEIFRTSFETGTSIDTAPPTLTGSWPDNNVADISLNPGSFHFQFSENLDPSTVNGNTVMLKRGSTDIAGEIKYDSGANSIYFAPSTSLLPGLPYTASLIGSSTGIKDLSGNALAENRTIIFTTSSSTDTTMPYVMFANGDEFGLAVSFSEPMQAANMTDAMYWPSSLLNPANGALKWGDLGNVATSGTAVDLTNKNLFYDRFNNTLEIENLGLDYAAVSGKYYYLSFCSGSGSDMTGNRLSSSTPCSMTFPIKSSSQTEGLLGPGSYVAPTAETSGLLKAGIFPKNSMAGQTSNYFASLPLTRSIPAGGQVAIAFPSGFDVSGAKKDAYSPANSDINGYNAGVVSFGAAAETSGGSANDGVTVDTATRQVKIALAGDPTNSSDYLNFELAGIINTAIPRGYDTSGYVAEVRSFDANGGLLETFAMMPFFINPAGTNNLTVNVSLVNEMIDGNSDNVRVHLGSTMTGPLEKEVPLNSSGTGAAFFNNLPNGSYWLFTEPVATLDGNDYSGLSMNENFYVSGSTTKSITFTRQAAGAGLASVSVDVTGSFGTDDIDIFASGPNSFKVKTIVDAGDNPSAIFYLPDGEWWIGLGPAAQKTSSVQTAMMPDWNPPLPQKVVVSGSGTIVYETAGTSSDSIIPLAVPVRDKQFIGYIKDADGNAIANAQVWAYQPQGANVGASAMTDISGRFVLKLAAIGNYMVGAGKEGLPNIPDTTIKIAADTGGGISDGNGTADVYRPEGSLVTALSPFVIKLKKAAYTISGKVTDGTNPVAYVGVWAQRSDNQGWLQTNSDASGNFILYAEPGTWYVKAYIPSYGQTDSRTVVIDSASEVVNLAPAASVSFITISGSVSVGGSAYPYKPIRAVQYNGTGTYTGKEYGGQTAGDGTYYISVPAGNNYRVDIWTPEYGERGLDTDEVADSPANVAVAGANVTGKNITINTAALRTISALFENSQSGMTGYLDIEGVDFSGSIPKPNGFKMSKMISDLTSSTTIPLADGDYFWHLYVPGLGEFAPDNSDLHPTKNDIAVSGDRSVTFTLTDQSSGMITVAGTVYAGTATSGNELAGAWVWINNPSNGYKNGVQAASDGSYSVNVPVGTGYYHGADAPLHLSADPIRFDAATATARNFVLTPVDYSVSGKIYKDLNANSAWDSGEELPNGYVRAESAGCSDNDDSTACRRSNTTVDGSGTYTLGLGAGTWKMFAVSPGFAETQHSSQITITNANQTANIKLNASNQSFASANKPVIPSSGGYMDDSAPGASGLKLIIPPNALGNSSAAGSVSANKTTMVIPSSSGRPAGETGIEVTATDNSGQAITTLNDYVDIEIGLYKSDVDSGIASGTMSYNLLKNAVNGYWDASLNDWINIDTVKKAYYKLSGDTEWKSYAESGTTTSAFSAFLTRIENGNITEVLAFAPVDYKLVYSSKTNHFTVFGIIMPVFVAPASSELDPDPEPDPAPAPSSPGGGGGVSVSYCASVVYSAWSSCSGGMQTREIASKDPAGCRLTTGQETGKSRTCLLALADAPTASETAESAGADKSADDLFLEQGSLIFRADVDEMLRAVSLARNHALEASARDIMSKKMGIEQAKLESRHFWALNNFIAYGTPDTLKLGAGERAGVVNSFKAAFGRWPKASADWSDVVKISNGRWPGQTSDQALKNAQSGFERIYQKIANRANARDDAALTIIAYGLRTAKRNQNSEATAIRIFKGIFKKNPATATDWDIVRCIAYSGAVREKDTDKDLLPDARELSIGTDPKKYDTDGDGYSDGQEIKAGYDPQTKLAKK